MVVWYVDEILTFSASLAPLSLSWPILVRIIIIRNSGLTVHFDLASRLAFTSRNYFYY